MAVQQCRVDGSTVTSTAVMPAALKDEEEEGRQLSYYGGKMVMENGHIIHMFMAFLPQMGAHLV